MTWQTTGTGACQWWCIETVYRIKHTHIVEISDVFFLRRTLNHIPCSIRQLQQSRINRKVWLITCICESCHANLLYQSLIIHYIPISLRMSKHIFYPQHHVSCNHFFIFINTLHLFWLIYFNLIYFI